MNTILLAEKQTPTLWENVAENALYVLVFFGIIVAMFLIAFGLEKLCNKKNNLSGKKEKFFTTRKMTAIGILCTDRCICLWTCHGCYHGVPENIA